MRKREIAEAIVSFLNIKESNTSFSPMKAVSPYLSKGIPSKRTKTVFLIELKEDVKPIKKGL